MVYYAQVMSPAGMLRLESDGENLTGLYFMPEDAAAQYPYRECPVFHSVRNWLDAYFRGDPYAPDFSMKLQGTPFQMQVWEILKTIPCGQVRTYGDIAREIAALAGMEKMSAQAVGQAVGRNPISIIVPCHRVVGAGGKLTGYAAGLEKKIWLLQHEGWLE
ncbi:MAG: methylated-DNA--[Oscillospiraceae bacterium]|nr:methylated-DNA--[protein]-cysteine S-methyltransferase [Oscillospiraceae bacterium]